MARNLFPYEARFQYQLMKTQQFPLEQITSPRAKFLT